MVKFLVSSSMILAVSMLVTVESAGFDMKQIGGDMMKLANSGMQAMQSFKPEDVKEMMDALKSPEERKAMGEVLLMIIQGKPVDDVIEKLLNTDIGPGLAEHLLPVVGGIMEMKEKYGKGIESVAAKKQK